MLVFGSVLGVFIFKFGGSVLLVHSSSSFSFFFVYYTTGGILSTLGGFIKGSTNAGARCSG